MNDIYELAYRLYSKDFWGEHHLSPMTMWGFQEIVPDKEKKYYLNRAKLSIRIKKIKHIKQKCENRCTQNLMIRLGNYFPKMD